MNYENRFCILANWMKMIIKNISKIVQVNRGNQKFIQSKHLDSINTIDDGYIEIEGSKIKNFGSMKDWRGPLPLSGGGTPISKVSEKKDSRTASGCLR